MSGTSIRLNWFDRSANENGFKIERKSTGTNYVQIAQVAANTTTYTNTGLLAGATYTYRLRAFNDAGDSLYSNEASATPPTPPAAPSGLTATALSATSVRLDWVDNSTNEQGFKVERRTSSTNYVEIASVGVNVHTFTDTGLTSGTLYAYRVRAFGLGGFSAYAGPVSITPPTLPLAPSALTAAAISGSQISLRWTDRSTNEQGFKIERKSGTTAFVQIAQVGANVTTYTNSGLLAGATYTYRVRAFNLAGNSGYSNEASATPVTLPTAPSALTATALSGTSVRLNWADRSTNEQGFKIERRTSSTAYAQIAQVGANVTTYTNTGLLAGATYFYRVRAFNLAGNSAYSNEASVSLPTLPAAPSNLTATLTSNTSVRLAWRDNSTNEQGFKIERRTSTTSYVEIATTGPGATSYNDSGLAVSTLYAYRVRAFNLAGFSAYAGPVNVTTTNLPSAPTGLAAGVSSATSVHLTWTDTSSSESGFKIERRTGSGAYAEIASVGANVRTFDNTGLTAGGTYTYRVRAYNASGTSGYSNEATATLAPPAAPSGLTGTVLSSTSVRLSWTDNSNGETLFRIERKIGAGSFVDIRAVPANTTTYTDLNLTAGTQYSYRVRAYNALGYSAYSNTVTVIP